MKLKILYLILFILIFIPIGLCEIIKDDINLNNIKIYDKNNETISIYDKNINKSMDIKLISTTSDIDKLIKIVEITNYIEYIPNENDFITKTKKIYGKNNVYKIEYFIEKYNYTFDYITINKNIYNNKTGKNEIKLINKTIVKNIKPFWVKFEAYNKQILKNKTFKLKIIHYKKPELGFFKIQTIPIFKNIECKEFTWWNGNWNLKRAILINNTYGDDVTNYQLKSVNLSIYQINASSARIINETSGLIQNHWNETIDSNGNLEYVWCNFSKILNNIWINETYYIYYQSNSIVNSVSNGTKTFIEFFNGDSTGWIEVDPNNHIIFQNNRLEFIDLNRNESAYVYKTITPITYDWVAEWDVTLTSKIDSGHVFTMGISSEIDDLYSHLGDSIGFDYYYAIPDGDELYIWEVDDGSKSYQSTFGVIAPNIRYMRAYRDGDTVYCTGYSDAIRTIPIHSTISKDITGVTAANLDNYFLLSSLHATGSAKMSGYINNHKCYKYTINKPEFWTVENIEYPEALDMNCSLKIITHLTEKQIQIVNMTGDIVNENTTNECISLTYDSYIVYMSNPVKISSFTELLNVLDNFLVQFLLFIFLIIIATLFYVFIQVVKKKGFKL